MERNVTPGNQNPSIYRRVRRILKSAQSTISRTVNSTQVVANWLIGKEIVEEQQRGKARAEYGERMLEALGKKLQAEFGAGYSLANLKLCRQFHVEFSELLTDEEIGYALRSQSGGASQLLRSSKHLGWQLGRLNPNLSWAHYRVLMRIDSSDARTFYEVETLKNGWSARELERQFASLLFERLAKTRDKRGVMRLAKNGQEIVKPADVFKDPLVMEFIGLPACAKLVESEVESALLSNLQAFLLELGKGFAFVARQQRLTLEGDCFYIDLVFYHVVLKCYVLVDLKVGKITHADIGQIQLYVNYYDMERRTQGDNPTLGLILCSDKNDAVVKYTLGPQQRSKIFASRYKLHLPSEAELQDELRREVRSLRYEKEIEP